LRARILIWTGIILVAVGALLILDAALGWCFWFDCWVDVAA
jgi:hypothetical protein